MMIFDLVPYFAIFALSMFMIEVFQRACSRIHVRGISDSNNVLGSVMYCIVGLLFLLPILAMYGLRYGIGTDYFSYEQIYNAIHDASFMEYWSLHSRSISSFYVEPGYYFLNKIFPTYRLLLWGIGILIFALFLIAVKDYFVKMSFSFALFVFLSTQFIYSLNGTRFTISLCFVLIGYIALANNNTKSFIVMVLIASLFHQTALFCLAMLFLKRYKFKEANSLRNIVFFTLIVLFPLFVGYLLKWLSSISIFERYFTTAQYFASDKISREWTWILHIVPVILPLIVFCRNEIFSSGDTTTFFRICIVEIPFRMLGLYNTMYTRVSRYAQIVQVILIPLIISKTANRKKKTFLYLYYIAWYLFYFAYYALVNDQGDSLPYVWIFS